MDKWITKKSIDREITNNLLDKCEETNIFTNYGENTKKLEEIIRNKLEIEDSKSIIVVTNGSVALHVLASAISTYHNIKINWATQSFTFPPSSQGSLRETKIVDIDNEGGLDINNLDEDINGIIVTNIFGNITRLEKYENWREKERFVIFDNAASSYTFYKGKSCCNYGTGCTISFHHTKPLGFGEGGAVIVDKKYEKIVRSLTNFGFGINKENFSQFHREGNNYKISEISAIYIIQYLKNFDKIVSKHRYLYNYMKNNIFKKKLPVSLFPSFHDDNKILPSCFCLIFEKYDDIIKEKLEKNNIICRKYYFPLSEKKIATKIYNNILCIPCNIDVCEREIDKVLDIIKLSLNSLV